MDIKKILSDETLSSIKEMSTEVIKFSADKKLTITCSFRDPEYINQSTPLTDIYHALSDKHQTFSVSGAEDDIEHLSVLITKMVKLLYTGTYFINSKLKYYCGDIKPRFCRESIPYLETSYIKGIVDKDDIKEIYDILGMPVPTMFL